jgi:hypothetical protein
MDFLRNENARLKKSATQSSAELAEMTKMLWGGPFTKI